MYNLAYIFPKETVLNTEKGQFPLQRGAKNINDGTDCIMFSKIDGTTLAF